MLFLADAHRSLGPKIEMVISMVVEAMVFVVFFLVLIIAYGTVRQTLLYPARSFREMEWDKGVNLIFNYAFYSMFGMVDFEPQTGNVGSMADPIDEDWQDERREEWKILPVIE